MKENPKRKPMKKTTPYTVEIKENPVEYIVLDSSGTYLCFSKEDLQDCLLAHQHARVFKAKELSYEITVTVK